MAYNSVKFSPRILLFGLFAAAITLRLIDFTDQPLDFNPARQLYSAIIARAIYYQGLPAADPILLARATAIRGNLEQLEPPVLETLAVWIYRLGGKEVLWAPRLYSIVFWLAGGAILYMLGREFLNGRYGALIGLAYFLFLPLGVYASRSFQPDPAMIAALLLSFWLLLIWDQRRTMKWAALAGLVGGLAVLLKGVGLFFIGGFLIGLLLARWYAASGALARRTGPIRMWFDLQVLSVMGLTAIPALVIYLPRLVAGSSLYTRSAIYHWNDLIDPSFYIRWLILIDTHLNLFIVLIAFAGVLLLPIKMKSALLGLWAGYGLYGLSFPKLIITHDYYQLPLLAIVSLSLIPAADLVAEKIVSAGRLSRLVGLGAFSLAVLYPFWISRSVMLAEDFREAPSYWETVGKAIPDNGKAIGYSQDYGFRLMYYGWQNFRAWSADIPPEEFAENAGDAAYFVITARNQANDDLEAFLAATFPILETGGGYVIYDLLPKQ